MTPFLPGYEPGTWVEIVSGPEMLCSLQYDYGTTFTLTDSLPYEPLLIIFQFVLHSSVISKSSNLLPPPPPGSRASSADEAPPYGFEVTSKDRH